MPTYVRPVGMQVMLHSVLHAGDATQWGSVDAGDATQCSAVVLLREARCALELKTTILN
jgi:hypothetical protein